MSFKCQNKKICRATPFREFWYSWHIIVISSCKQNVNAVADWNKVDINEKPDSTGVNAVGCWDTVYNSNKTNENIC